MSALTERVAGEHRPYRDPVAPGRLWLCECDNGGTSRDIVAHVYHVAAATEQAVRASVAAEIREYWDACGELIDTHNGARLAFDAIAAAVAEGQHP